MTYVLPAGILCAIIYRNSQELRAGSPYQHLSLFINRRKYITQIIELVFMHRDVDVILCQPLGSGCERNKGSDTAALQGSLAFFAGYVGVHAGIFLVVVDV